MDERPEKIISHIEAERNRLSENFNELETRVRDTTDWRNQFNRHPYVGIGIALGGGLLLGSALLGNGGRTRTSAPRETSSSEQDWSPQPEYSPRAVYSSASPSSASTSAVKQQAISTVENIKGALMALAATKAKDYLDGIIPGFRQHYEETERRPGSGRSSNPIS